MTDRKMRILIINYYYPPVVDAHAYRWEQIARHWITQGHQVEVITSCVHGISNCSVDAGVSVTRVGLIARPTSLSSGSPAPPGLGAKLRAPLVNILRPLYSSLYWPDAMWHWIPSVLFEVIRRKSAKYDLVVSYYPCIGAHLAAAAIKSWINVSELTWIADYGDPFSISKSMPPNNFSLYSRLNKFIERRIARLADFLVFTNESTAAGYEATVSAPEKVRVIPHLVDVGMIYAGARELDRAAPSGAGPLRTTNLLYIGGFHRGIREPDLLFDLVRKLNLNSQHQYILKIYGPSNGFDLSPKDCPQIIYCGMVERKTAIKLMRQADILINVDNKNCVMVPSKVVEYIGTGRPLINLGNEGVQHKALQRYVDSGYAISINGIELSTTELKSVVNFIMRYAGSVAPLDVVEVTLSEYSLQRVGFCYMDILSSTDLFREK